MNSEPTIESDLLLGIDYLTLILPIENEADTLAFIDSMSRIFSESYELHRGHGRFVGRQFSNWANSPSGGLITWNLPGENGESLTHGSLRMALGGKVLVRAKVLQIVRLISTVFAANGKCTRIDLKADDYTRAMCPNLLEKASNDKNRTGFNDGYKVGQLGSTDLKEKSWTLYFGSRKSDRFTRYYNAKPLHNIEAWRFEVEYKNEIAHEIATHLCYASDDEEVLSSLIGAYIAGNISFVDRSSSGSKKNVDRCSMLDFWKDFTDRLGSSVRLSLPAVVPSLQRSIEWLETRVSATLAMISEYFGFNEFELFKRLKKIGRERMGPRHYNLLETCSREPYKVLTLSDDSFMMEYQYNE